MIWMLVAAGGATGASIIVPLVVQRVVDGPVRHHQPGALIMLGALAMLLGLLEAVLIFIRRWTQTVCALGMETTQRNDLYRHLQRLPVAFHEGWQSGQLLSRATSDLSTIRRFMSFGLIFLIVNIGTYITVVALLFHLYWPLAVVVTAGSVPLFMISRDFTKQYFAAARLMQDQQGDLATLAEEAAQGVRTIKAYGRRGEVGTKYRTAARLVHDTGVRKARMVARTWSRFDLVPNITLAIVLVGGAYAVAKDEMTIGGLVAFVTLELMLIWPVDALGWIISNLQESMTAADRIYEVFDSEVTIKDRPGAVALNAADVAGEVRFDDVRFTFPDAADPVLRGINLHIRHGETMALVGVTGSGKSALISLVPRLHDVTGGRITIDGHDIRDLPLDNLRDLIGVAFEEPTLFSMSVRENLTLGRPNATDEQVAEAIAIAQAGFVYELPWGLDTRVGEQGLSLSGGQRQRLALARAVLGRPRVLVLDDPLSALDVHTEALVEEALARVLAGSTALVVVHRPSTVALADRVALLENGVITHVGTHSELLATVPAYRAVLSAEAELDDGPTLGGPPPWRTTPNGAAATDQERAVHVH
ncbi:MAG TPA: ABC transporter ATP-binding protein [Micromonosporaceae bacterium]|nr:ABC transporter ATP-binding protein [Micromonosporaceae bacterium]